MAVDDLHEQRDFLLRSLNDLDREREAGEIEESDYIALRDAYTAQAADVLRAIDRESSGALFAPGVTGDAKREEKPRRPMTRVIAGGVAVVLFASFAGALVARSSGDRVPGQSSSGTAGRAGDSTLARAHELMGQGKALDAIKLFDAVLRDNPRNADALAYRGWLLQLAGLPDEALLSIDKALEVDPNYPDANFFKGMTLYQGKHDPAAAIPHFRAFLAANPKGDLVPAVEQVLERAMKDAGEAPSPPQGS